MEDGCAIGDALGSAQGAWVGRSNKLGALGEEANTFVVVQEEVPPVEVGVELNSGEGSMKAREKARAVNMESQAHMTRGPATLGNSWRSIGKMWTHPAWEENAQRQW